MPSLYSGNGFSPVKGRPSVSALHAETPSGRLDQHAFVRYCNLHRSTWFAERHEAERWAGLDSVGVLAWNSDSRRTILVWAQSQRHDRLRHRRLSRLADVVFCLAGQDSDLVRAQFPKPQAT